MDKGFAIVGLGSLLRILHVVRDADGLPIDADAAPTFRVYGASGLMPNGTGTLSLKDSGTITGATNATPIAVTSSNHKLSDGTLVTISGVGGNTAANGTFEVQNAATNDFELSDSVGNGSYTSGGSWHVAGLYELNFTPAGGSGFAVDTIYSILVSWLVDGDARSETISFMVV